MKLRRSTLGAVLFSSALILSACATPAGPLANPVVTIEETIVETVTANPTGTYPSVMVLRPGHYVGTVTEPNSVAEGANITGNVGESHDGQSLSFSVGCNTVNGSLGWQVDPATGAATPIIGEFAQTLIGCPEPLDSQERFLTENLNSGQFEITSETEFRFGNITFNWQPEPEPGPVPEVPPDGEYDVAFEETNEELQSVSHMLIGTASVTDNGTMIHFDAGCNQISAPLTDGVLGPVRSTRMACEDDERERVLLEQLDAGHFEMVSDKSFRIGGLTFQQNLSN